MDSGGSSKSHPSKTTLKFQFTLKTDANQSKIECLRIVCVSRIVPSWSESSRSVSWWLHAWPRWILENRIWHKVDLENRIQKCLRCPRWFQKYFWSYLFLRPLWKSSLPQKWKQTNENFKKISIVKKARVGSVSGWIDDGSKWATWASVWPIFWLKIGW